MFSGPYVSEGPDLEFRSHAYQDIKALLNLAEAVKDWDNCFSLEDKRLAEIEVGVCLDELEDME